MNPKVLFLAIRKMVLLITEVGSVVGGTDFGGGGHCTGWMRIQFGV